jgi:hypothetical protein
MNVDSGHAGAAARRFDQKRSVAAGRIQDRFARPPQRPAAEPLGEGAGRKERAAKLARFVLHGVSLSTAGRGSE